MATMEESKETLCLKSYENTHNGRRDVSDNFVTEKDKLFSGVPFLNIKNQSCFFYLAELKNFPLEEPNVRSFKNNYFPLTTRKYDKKKFTMWDKSTTSFLCEFLL